MHGSSGSTATAGCTTAFATGATAAPGSSSASIREQAAQPRQAVVPGGADVDHPRDRIAERLERHLVARLAAAARRAQEARVCERGQLLRDRLARDRKLRRELGGRRGPARGDGLNERTPSGV